MPITFEEPAGPRSVSTLRFLAKAIDIGYGERIDGGHVLEWVDKAGYACASE